MVLSVWQIAKDTSYAYYFSRYASARETYKDAMEEYKASGKHAAWRRDPAKPKRPLSGSRLLVAVRERRTFQASNHFRPSRGALTLFCRMFGLSHAIFVLISRFSDLLIDPTCIFIACGEGIDDL